METSGFLGTEDIDDCCCNPRTPHSLYIHLTRLVPTMLTSKRRALGEKMHSFDQLIAQPARSISSVNCFLKFQLREILSERFTMAATLVSSNKVFSGFQKVFKHASTTLGAEAKFGIYLPKSDHKVPVIYWLSGLTCTEQNFITKAGAQNYAQKYGVAIVCPDTSPRNCNIPGEDDSYDLGTGAGFYVDATQEPWSKNYKMYSYVTKELPQVIEANFSEFIDTSRCSIMGHSMGGHGALICSLKNPGKYKAVSAFAPICNPSNCGWGQKAFTAYLGDDKKAWSEYDATELAKSYSGPPLEVLVDQGLNDEFLKALLPANLIAVGNEKFKIKYREQEGYDHSYFTIATFIEDHIKMHSEALK